MQTVQSQGENEELFALDFSPKDMSSSSSKETEPAWSGTGTAEPPERVGKAG